MSKSISLSTLLSGINDELDFLGHDNRNMFAVEYWDTANGVNMKIKGKLREGQYEIKGISFDDKYTEDEIQIKQFVHRLTR